MSSAYTPSPVPLTTITIPSDGDTRDAASVNVPFEQLADAIAAASPLVVVVNACFRDYERDNPAGLVSGASINLEWLPVASGTAQLEFTSGGTRFLEVNTGSNDQNLYAMMLDAAMMNANGLTLSKVEISLSPYSSHGGLPQSLPAISVSRASFDGATQQNLKSTANGWAGDTSANLAAYELQHTLIYTANQHNVIDTSAYVYLIAFAMEAGSNAHNSLYTGPLKLTFTR